MADKYGVPRHHTNYVEMFDVEQPDFVDVITPPHSHAEICAEAASRNIHIICQKPLAPSFDEAAALVRQITGEDCGIVVFNNEPFKTGGPDYLRTLRIQEAIYESAATGKQVDI